MDLWIWKILHETKQLCVDLMKKRNLNFNKILNFNKMHETIGQQKRLQEKIFFFSFDDELLAVNTAYAQGRIIIIRNIQTINQCE